MSLIGNDVIDVAESGWDDRGDPRRFRRFVTRVCSERESAVVFSAREPAQALAVHFAAKEAAYKVVAKLSPGCQFAHRRFHIDLQGQCVRHEAVELRLRIQRLAGVVHAWAWTGAGAITTDLASRDDATHPSLSVRALASRLAASRLGVCPSRLQIVRPTLVGSWDGRGPPLVLCSGEPVALDLSLSHHGQYVACALIEPTVAGLSVG